MLSLSFLNQVLNSFDRSDGRRYIVTPTFAHYLPVDRVSITPRTMDTMIRMQINKDTPTPTIIFFLVDHLQFINKQEMKVNQQYSRFYLFLLGISCEGLVVVCSFTLFVRSAVGPDSDDGGTLGI
jgi:hypothetical protein